MNFTWLLFNLLFKDNLSSPTEKFMNTLSQQVNNGILNHGSGPCSLDLIKQTEGGVRSLEVLDRTSKSQTERVSPTSDRSSTLSVDARTNDAAPIEISRL